VRSLMDAVEVDEEEGFVRKRRTAIHADGICGKKKRCAGTANSRSGNRC
jgi:hypothetical protein